VSRLSRKCGSLYVPQPYGPPRPVTGIDSLFLLVLEGPRNRISIIGGTTDFSLLCSVQTGLGRPTFLFNRYRGLFPRRVRRPERETDHSPHSSTEIKNAWSYTSTSLGRHQDMFQGEQSETVSVHLSSSYLRLQSGSDASVTG
jgi:hypothetical protein